MIKPTIYRMTCLTNLHVGNGDVNYSIIDNEVERDPVYKEPVIPSSGVKGALLEYAKSTYNNAGWINKVFGNDNQKGEYKFLSAGILARPVRISEGNGSYLLATSEDLLRQYYFLCTNLGIPVQAFTFPSPVITPSDSFTTYADNLSIEGRKLKYISPTGNMANTSKCITDLLGGSDNWCVLAPDVLRSISLPVIARNCLNDDGKSENLWYEEFVPHHSVFYLIILAEETENILDTTFVLDKQVVQFGANASIGYGLMKIEKI